jgi:Papain-like cysteine protease AvrRpt2
MSTSRTTRDLEQHVGRRRARRRLVRAYDAGNPIDLRYTSPEPPQHAGPPVTPAAPPIESATSPFTPVASPVTPAAAPPVTPPAVEPVGSAPAAGGPPPSPAPAAALPPASAPDTASPPRPRYTADDDERATAAAFHEDLAAILATAASHEPEARGVGAPADAFMENALSNARSAPPATDDDEEQAEAADEAAEAEAVSLGHDIFDRLQFANQYDVGPVRVDLGAKFDDFDREIVKAETAKARRAQSGRAAPEPIAHMQTIEDLSTLPKSGYAAVVAERMAEAAEEAGPQSFSVVYDVPLVPQQTGMSCWAAGAAMIVAWRDKVSVDPSEIARADGYWAQYAAGLAPEDTTIFKTWGLEPETAQSYTVQAFRSLLETWGPLWTGGLLKTGGLPTPHIRVVAGIEGDGTPDGTRVHILDPWEPGMVAFKLPNAGGRYTETYAEYERNQATLGQQEQAVQGIYVAHAKERLRR